MPCASTALLQAAEWHAPGAASCDTPCPVRGAGNDLNESITPVEAGLTWTIGKKRREKCDFLGGEVRAPALCTHVGSVQPLSMPARALEGAQVRARVLRGDWRGTVAALLCMIAALAVICLCVIRVGWEAGGRGKSMYVLWTSSIAWIAWEKPRAPCPRLIVHCGRW